MHIEFLVLSLIQVSAALQFPVQFLSVYKSMAPNPSPTRLDPEAYPEAPPGLALEQVHVYIRHGERTPVGVRMNRPPASIPEYWPMCFAGRKFSAPVWEPSTILNEAYSAATVDLNRVVELRNGSATPGVCMLGELTDIGRTQVINGLYPDGKSPQRPYLLIRNAKDENIIPNHFSCKRLERMAVSFSQAAAEKLNPTLKPLDKRISRYIDGEPVRIDGKPRASGILDTIRAAKAHGIRVPKDFNDPEVMDLIEYAVVQEWFGLGYKNHEYRKLAMGPLLSDLQSKMQKKVDEGEKDPLKLLVYSTHDTALAGIVSALDVFDHRWPEFTASVTFELFKKTPEVIQQSTFLGLNFKWTDLVPSSVGIRGTADVPSPSDYFVRMRYQNNSMTIPHCAKSGNHLGGSPEFCTLKAFQEHIKALTPDDWDAECVPPQPNPTL
ncbi:hypothetical protein FS842_004013 [Serendipita sp. 407]|nr:hypothetical protein FS842_004013 [Serendipita sp. 407]